MKHWNACAIHRSVSGTLAASMDGSNTLVTLLIGGAGVGVAALVDALGVPTAASSLIGLSVVVAIILVRRQFRGPSDGDA